MVEYTHLELNKEYHSISGFYILDKENFIKYRDREVFYVTGQANAESSCCGSGNWKYVLVPGYVVSWQNKKNTAGQIISQIEIIDDPEDKDKIRKIIHDIEPAVARIEIW